MRKQIEQIGKQNFIWSKPDKLEVKDIEQFIKDFLDGTEYKRLNAYGKYYEAQNPDVLARWQYRQDRKKTPNNLVPTAYYSTIVDSMAGYMFQNIQYESKDQAFNDAYNNILKENKSDIKDMVIGVNALAYNKAIELVYTIGDGKTTDIKFTPIDPRQMIVIYNNDIEPKIFCGIRIIKSIDKDFDYMVDVIYSNEWQYYKMKDNKLSAGEKSKELFFKECPVIEYNTEILNNNSSFHVILPYIDALDILVTGNANDIDSLVDAILVLSKILKPEDKEDMASWKTLEGISKEDRAEYLEKNTSPEFRSYASRLLIQEIHKHSHVIDWYSPDTGLTGEVSAKALITRLFDMDMYSKRLEKVFRKGAELRIKLISELMNIRDSVTSKNGINIIYNRTLPNDVTDKASLLKDVSFLSTKTKVEICGLNWAEEKIRLEEEQKINDERMRIESDEKIKLLMAETAANKDKIDNNQDKNMEDVNNDK